MAISFPIGEISPLLVVAGKAAPFRTKACMGKSPPMNAGLAGIVV
ncbi:MAG: hypothetical protein ACJAVJ_000979 [Planctomycetota bacterium]|jgi:hypothetical protein